MSQIVIEIPIEALSRANVAKALTELTMALGGHSPAPAAPVAAPIAYAAPKAEPVAAPAPVAAAKPAPAPKVEPVAPAPVAAAPEPAPVRVKGKPGRKPGAAAAARAAAAAAPAPKAPEPAPAPAQIVKVKGKPGRKPGAAAAAKAAAAAAAAPAPTPAAGSIEERWKSYMADLPENSRKFLELLERNGQLTVTEAVEKLNLASPKAMGGLTGAMARWAPKQGIPIPYEAREKADGTRYWVWKGVK